MVGDETDSFSETDVEGKFTNGGTAALDGTSVTLSNVTSGDKVTFKIKVTNNSYVAIKYCTVISTEEDTGLFSELSFTIGESKFDGLNNKSKWTKLT